jgi:hypothetical protein
MSSTIPSSKADGASTAASVVQHGHTEEQKGSAIKRDAIPAVRSAEPGELIKAKACIDVRLVEQYLFRHPELLGGKKIQDPKDLADARVVKVIPNVTHYIVQVATFTIEQQFHHRKPIEFLPDTRVISPDQFATYLALQKEVEKTEEDISFITNFLYDHRKELISITGIDPLYFDSLSCAVRKQPDDTYLITATGQSFAQLKSSRSLSKTEFEALIDRAKKIAAEEENQKNLQLVIRYLESHPALLGIKTTKKPNDDGSFCITGTIEPKPDGTYDLHFDYKILDRHLHPDGLDYEPLPSWRFFEKNFSLKKEQFIQLLEQAKRGSGT